MARTFLCALLALAALSCSDDVEPTEVIVLVNTDFRPVTELAHVQVTVVGNDTATKLWNIVRRNPGEHEAVVPFSFGIEPPGGDVNTRIDLTVTGLDAGMNALVRRRARVGFVPHQLRLLKIDLIEECARVFESCEIEGSGNAPSTCEEGECAGIDVDVRDLPHVHRGDELADAGLIPQRPTDEDGGTDPTRTCTTPLGFFADVGRELAATADCTLCPVIAQNRLFEDDGSTLAENTSELIGLIDAALDSEFDIVELWVSQEGSTLYATGFHEQITAVPELGEILDYPRLQDANQPLKLFVTGNIPATDTELADTLLPFLLARQAKSEGGYGAEGRPVYLEAGKPNALPGLLAVQSDLASDSTYASLRGHIHFGGYVGVFDSVTTARDTIDRCADAGFDFIEIESDNENFFPAMRYAQGKGLHVFAREVADDGLYTPLCGIVDALATPLHSIESNLKFRNSITTSITLADLDVTRLESDATRVPYSGPWGEQEERKLNATTPSLVTDGDKAPLPGTSLSFTADSRQSLILNDPPLPAGFRRVAVLALLQMDPAALPSGGHAVIASKRHGSSGWALELIDAGGADGKQVRFQVFVRNSDNTLLERTAAISASLFTASVSHPVLAAVDLGAFLRLRSNRAFDNHDVDFYYTFEDNASPITLGRDPGASDNFFDGKLQLLKVTSYQY